MIYWWVNQNQTLHDEVNGGFMWSPKTKANGTRNPFYDNMTKVRTGDIVFSFAGTRIPYLGIIKSEGYSSNKPNFSASVDSWEKDGWKVDVEYRELENKIRPKDYIYQLANLLPQKYSPLQANGNGNQGVYLTQLPEELALKLLSIIESNSKTIIDDAEGLVSPDLEGDEVQKKIERSSITDTEKKAIIKARIGQGQFRNNVIQLHKKCPFTGISYPKFLKAGHIKPWSKCKNNQERMDPLNGLPLTPDWDLLIDSGFATLDDNGLLGSVPVFDICFLGINGRI